MDVAKTIDIDFPKFDGSSVRTWVKKCEKCFSLCKTPYEQKVILASFSMIGRADVWVTFYLYELYDNRKVEWSAFVMDVSEQFRTPFSSASWVLEDKEFKDWEDSIEKYITECGGFVKKDVVMEEKDEIAVDTSVVKSFVWEKKYDQDDVIDILENKEDVDIVVSDEVSFQPAIKEEEQPCQDYQVFDGNLDKGSMKDNIQVAVILKEDRSCQCYQMPNGNSDVASANKWQVEPLPWRDKTVVVGVGLERQPLIDMCLLVGKDCDLNGSYQGTVLQATEIDEEDQLCQTYQVPQLMPQVSGLEIPVQCGSFDNTSEKEWKVKPFPWRDKTDSCVIYEVMSIDADIEKLLCDLSNGKKKFCKNIGCHGDVGFGLHSTLIDKEQGDQCYQFSVLTMYDKYVLRFPDKLPTADYISSFLVSSYHEKVWVAFGTVVFTILGTTHEMLGLEGLMEIAGVYEINGDIRPLPWRDKTEVVLWKPNEIHHKGKSYMQDPSLRKDSEINVYVKNFNTSNGEKFCEKLVDYFEMGSKTSELFQEAQQQLWRDGKLFLELNSENEFCEEQISYISLGKDKSQFKKDWKMRPMPWRDKFVKPWLLTFEFIMRYMSTLGNMHELLSVNVITAWGISGSSLFYAFRGLYGYMYVKKWKGVRIDKSSKAELVTGPRLSMTEQLSFGANVVFCCCKVYQPSVMSKLDIQFLNAFNTFAEVVVEDSSVGITLSLCLHYFSSQVVAQWQTNCLFCLFLNDVTSCLFLNGMTSLFMNYLGNCCAVFPDFSSLHKT